MTETTQNKILFAVVGVVLGVTGVAIAGMMIPVYPMPAIALAVVTAPTFILAYGKLEDELGINQEPPYEIKVEEGKEYV